MKVMTEFHMPEWAKEQVLARHQFFLDQARARLLSQFENMEVDADRASDEWLSLNSHRFDPDRHDVGDFYDRASDIGIEFYQSLCDMREQTRLSVVAGMFHLWDKELRGWMANEIRHWGKLKHFTDEVWASSFDGLITLLDACGWNVRALPGFNDLDACRWVVNVYKHGDGMALEKLRKTSPHFLLQSYPQGIDWTPDITYRNHNDLTVTEADITTFSDAIMEFWKAMPLIIDASSTKITAEMPQRFSEALKKDWKNL